LIITQSGNLVLTVTQVSSKESSLNLVVVYSILRVSSEDMVQDSEDDAEQEYSDHYEDSFIDDRIEPTVGTSQADDGAVDMMAVYRYFFNIL